jgi:hypothetical protein
MEPMAATKDRQPRPRTTHSDHVFDDVRRLLREANETSARQHDTCAYLQARDDSACEIIVQHITGGTIERASAMVERYRERKGEIA